MEGESLNLDLEGTPCSVIDCGDMADELARATVRLPPAAGAVVDDLVLVIPLCIHHSHLSRHGVDLIDWHDGMPS